MKNTYRWAHPLSAIVVIVTGCTTPNLMHANRYAKSQDLAADEAILVVGQATKVFPAWDRVVVEGDRVKKLHAPGGRSPVMDIDSPRFAVWRLKNVLPGMKVGIVSIGTGSAAYYACEGAKMPVATISPQEVVYVGDLDYSLENGKLLVHWRSSFSEAKKHLRQEIPKSAEKLQERTVTFLESDAACPGGATTIPIYIPAGK